MSEQVFDPVFNVAGKTVVLTGGCGLIGRAIVEALHQRGAKLVIADVEAADPEAFAASFGDSCIGVPTDVADANSVAQLLSKTLEHFGQVDVLINNHHAKPKGFLEGQAENFPEELWDHVLDVNLKGTFLTCRDFGSQMLKQGAGSVINMASTYGVVSSNPALYEDNQMGNPVAYSASKGGVIMLTQYLGCYWASRGVRVNCITPHGVWNHHEEAFENRFSAMSPMKRMMKAEEIVGSVLYLASDASSYSTGSNVLVEGGWTAW
ncbi:SDR family oxidoreductase [Aestuariispira insulae]|uniref:NAD(P)-dependent dehydrogenase (Short-subunit alcohol dehydrogenase family) n=1 Tax=Aestuariispira insulae TaxID=1461337 RepID=A0A3D9H550_9PROT|nr:SDR family oxidoreductase [Aestuariispira insulae]RED44301.1 NAD(P)-dependent dehydrogenase (short-subunit alcohol dehydrogenase family) [Aestuariispira insulae]